MPVEITNIEAVQDNKIQVSVDFDKGSSPIEGELNIVGQGDVRDTGFTVLRQDIFIDAPAGDVVVEFSLPEGTFEYYLTAIMFDDDGGLLDQDQKPIEVTLPVSNDDNGGNGGNGDDKNFIEDNIGLITVGSLALGAIVFRNRGD